MSPTTAAALSATLALLGVAATRRAVVPRQLTVRQVRSRAAPLTARSAVSDTTIAPTRADPLIRLGGVVADGPVGSAVLAQLERELWITDTTVPQLIGRVIGAVSVVAMTVVLAAATLSAAGVAPLGVWWLAVVAAVMMAAGWQVIADLRARAERRQAALLRAAGEFVQLVAVGLTTNRSVEEAVEFAVAVGDGDEFEALRRVVTTAPQTGRPVWEALAAFADEHDLDGLHGLCDSLAQQASIGVSVADTVRAEAEELRNQQLDSLTDAADRANENLSFPTMAMVLGMVLFLAYPVMQRISEAFAG